MKKIMLVALIFAICVLFCSCGNAIINNGTHWIDAEQNNKV